MGWFRSSALVTVIVGIRYFTIHLAADAKLAGDRSLIGKVWLVVSRVARRICALSTRCSFPRKGFSIVPGCA